MGRGRVQLKRIENKISRQVTFSKRRTSLLKKAHEISVLCEADVALIVFSTKGKLYEYSTDSRMENILEQYERSSQIEPQLLAPANAGLHQQNWGMELPKLTNRFEVLQKNLRQYAGEELNPLSLRELHHLEQQIDSALKRIRSRKNHLMHESIIELHKQEKALKQQNNMLAKRIKENDKGMEEGTQREQRTNNNCQISTPSRILLPPPSPSPSPSSIFLPPPSTSDPFQKEVAVNEKAEGQTQHSTMPPWMLHHVNQ
ncbi:truncated transcription factor CAULIFLOWER A-like [Carica papaya]|uniref:truncated transcription factor CAULIFLOWER A-like n=1 Tax=Carica papaya TaxID=3649 RepID=UPI000B8CBEE2|nr:truncated transcription factor CAULIFLOWER A-like [Carica papaya]